MQARVFIKSSMRKASISRWPYPDHITASLLGGSLGSVEVL